LLADQVNGIAQGSEAHPRFLRTLRERTDDLVDDWHDGGDLGELEKDTNRILDELERARRRDRVDGDVATELDATLSTILDLAGLDRVDGRDDEDD
jgi:hypothetical protein